MTQPVDVDALLARARAKKLHGVQDPGSNGHTNGHASGHSHASANGHCAQDPVPPASASTVDAGIFLLKQYWPAKGVRHTCSMALAGGLVRGGMSDEQALAVLTAVAGPEPKRRAHVDDARAHKDAGTPYTGFNALSEHIDPFIVTAARGLLGLSDRVDIAAMEGFGVTVQAAPPKTLFTFGGWTSPVTPVEYVVENLIVRGSVNMFVAHGNSIKTWTLLSMLSCVADGRPWLDRYQVKQGRVGILDYENGHHEVHRRLRVLQADGSELGYSFGEASLTDPNLWRAIAEFKLTVLGVDSLAAGSWGVDENSTQAHVPLQFAKVLGEKVGTATVFIHHARKGDGKSDRRLEVRGASAIFAACDSVYTFSNEAGEGKALIQAIKTRHGQTPGAVSVQLSDASGMTWYEDETRQALVTGGGDPLDGLMGGIKLHLRDGAASASEITIRLNKRKKDVLGAVSVLLERGEIVKEGGGPRTMLRLDSAADREVRVLTALSLDSEIQTSRQLAKAAGVTVGDVEDLEKRGVIAKCALGYQQMNGPAYG